MKLRSKTGTGVQLLVIILVLVLSCKKDPEKIPLNCETSTEYLAVDVAGFKVKKNTYWVYLDSVSMTIDSVYVDSVLYSGLYPKSSCITETYEGYGFRTRTSTDSTKKDVYALKSGAIDRNAQSTTDVNSTVYVAYNFGDVAANSSLTVVKKDSLFIYDRYYKNVVIIYNPNDHNESAKTAYYANAEFGFLKKETYSASNVLLSRKLLKSKNIIR